MFEPYEYNITVKKVVLDGEHFFVAKVKEFPYIAV